MPSCLVLTVAPNYNEVGATDVADCHSQGGVWAYKQTEWQSIMGPPVFPLTPSAIADAWGFGFTIAAIPMLSALVISALLQFIKR